MVFIKFSDNIPLLVMLLYGTHPALGAHNMLLFIEVIFQSYHYDYVMIPDIRKLSYTPPLASRHWGFSLSNPQHNKGIPTGMSHQEQEKLHAKCTIVSRDGDSLHLGENSFLAQEEGVGCVEVSNSTTRWWKSFLGYTGYYKCPHFITAQRTKSLDQSHFFVSKCPFIVIIE